MGKKLYVGNLPYTTTEEELKNVFASAGTVISSKVIMDRDTGRSKGFGFVEMSTDAEAANAIATLNEIAVGGRNLRINEAQPMAPRGARPSHGAAPSHGGGGYSDEGFSPGPRRDRKDRRDRRDGRDRY